MTTKTICILSCDSLVSYYFLVIRHKLTILFMLKRISVSTFCGLESRLASEQCLNIWELRGCCKTTKNHLFHSLPFPPFILVWITIKTISRGAPNSLSLSVTAMLTVNDLLQCNMPLFLICQTALKLTSTSTFSFSLLPSWSVPHPVLWFHFADEGILRIYLRGRAVNMYAPSSMENFDAKSSGEAPKETLKLEWVYPFPSVPETCLFLFVFLHVRLLIAWIELNSNWSMIYSLRRCCTRIRSAILTDFIDIILILFIEKPDWFIFFHSTGMFLVTSIDSLMHVIFNNRKAYGLELH